MAAHLLIVTHSLDGHRPLLAKTYDKIELVQPAINENRRLTVWELADDLGMSKSSVWSIFD